MTCLIINNSFRWWIFPKTIWPFLDLLFYGSSIYSYIFQLRTAFKSDESCIRFPSTNHKNVNAWFCELKSKLTEMTSFLCNWKLRLWGFGLLECLCVRPKAIRIFAELAKLYFLPELGIHVFQYSWSYLSQYMNQIVLNRKNLAWSIPSILRLISPCFIHTLFRFLLLLFD